ncbi:AI-2E family transporter [Sphingobacterium arenae]|uniref:AI-2E family transporter n=1 Tax=Sphingobacterium arenae TaxID=1280598 RepID=A0ABR7Y4V1_9SPHI|nr:AI-2E family transporter [Sphingobacterium arenae]MBD1426283.1 AI-2E family transporter [Sphingobacterium arenae]HLT88245.1 AI-2E family transporter [Sphingobacterium sp.]
MGKTISKTLQVTFTLVLIVIILYYGKDVLAPLAIAGILSMLFVSPSLWMEKKGVPRWASTLIAVGILVMCIAGIGFLLSWQLQNFAEQISSLKQNLSQMLSNLQHWIQDRFDIDQAKQRAITETQMKDQSTERSSVTQLASVFFGLLVDFILVIVYTYLLLFYRSRLKNFLLKLTAPKDQEKAMEIVDSVSQVAANYMTGLAKMIVVLWILYGVGFTAIGVENALFFAVICGLLELIPFIGNLTGTAITVLGVTAQGGETNMILGVILIYGVVQFVQTYLLEPLIVGSEVHINPLFTIFSLVAAEAVWGIPGMILAIPLTGMIKIICDRIPRLQPYGYLIGSDKKTKSLWKRKFF